MTVYYPQAAVGLRILFEDFDGAAKFSGKEHNLVVTPKNVSVAINDYRTADTFKMELDYKTFPFDPRTLRAVGVSIFIEDMGKPFENDVQRRIKPTDTTFRPGSNAVFLGFADKNAITFDDTSRVVRLEGRDYTSLYIDSTYDNKKPIALDTPLENVIADLSLQLKATSKIQFVTVIDDVPTLAEFYPDFNPLATTRSKKKQESYWDVIQELVRKAGLICYVELDRLILSKPNAIYDKKKLKQFIWGKNLSSLDFERKLGRLRDFNIAVRSMNIEKKEVIEAKIPEEASKEWAISTGIPAKRIKIEKLTPEGEKSDEDAKFLTFRIPDIAKKEHLIEVAQSIYEELGRQQIEGKFETKEMCVREGASRDLKNNPGVEFDVTKIRNATPIDLRIFERDQIDSQVASELGVSVESLAQDTVISRDIKKSLRTKYLVQKCYPENVAEALADTMGKFDTPFYTKAVQFDFDIETGFKMKLDFINFIELSQSLIGG